MAYADPLSQIKNLVIGRTDQGFDITGSGPILALGSGTVVNTYTPGWPGTTHPGGGGYMMVFRLDQPYQGHQYYYYAENVTPTVGVGQRVTAGQQVGIVSSPAGSNLLEMGWASPTVIGDSLAMTDYRSEGKTPPAGWANTPEGANFKALVMALHNGTSAALTSYTTPTSPSNPSNPSQTPDNSGTCQPGNNNSTGSNTGEVAMMVLVILLSPLLVLIAAIIVLPHFRRVRDDHRLAMALGNRQDVILG